MGVLPRYVEIPDEAIMELMKIVATEEKPLHLSEVETLGNPKTVREYAIAALPHIARRHPEQAERFQHILGEISDPLYEDEVEASLESIVEVESGG